MGYNMNIHIIKNNVVINTILGKIEFAEKTYPDAICIEAPKGFGIGDSYINGVWTKYQRSQEEIDAEQVRKDRIAAIEAAKAELSKIKAERTDSLTMNYLDKRLSAIETILGL